MTLTQAGYATFMGVLLGTVMAASQPSSLGQHALSAQGQKQEATPHARATGWPEPSSNTPALQLDLQPQRPPRPDLHPDTQLLYVHQSRVSATNMRRWWL